MGAVKEIATWRGPMPWLAGVLCCLLPADAAAECRVLRGTEGASGALSLRLSGDCTERDREAEAVTAAEILQALKEGRAVDLENVLVTGDLVFDVLPVVSPDRLEQRHPGLAGALGAAPGGPLHTTSARLSLKNSHVHGRVTAHPERGHLVLAGPVTLAGTSFHRSVDFTRTVFLEPLEASRASFEQEALFIQARFVEDARFEEAAFGVRARFHRSRFLGPAVFVGARFNGMAEFLEVAFMQGARFARAKFAMGAGFSGSRFEGPVDLSDALFAREAFFLYTTFGAEANFQRATFRGLADFSHAEFRGAADFAAALFDREPRFSRTASKGTGPQRSGGQDPRVLYSLAAVLMTLTLLLLWARRRG